MGTKNNPGQYDCYAKAAPDEPLFTLRAKDPLAPMLVRLWALRAEKAGAEPEKVTEARACADAMDVWRKHLFCEICGSLQASTQGGAFCYRGHTPGTWLSSASARLPDGTSPWVSAGHGCLTCGERRKTKLDDVSPPPGEAKDDNRHIICRSCGSHYQAMG